MLRVLLRMGSSLRVWLKASELVVLFSFLLGHGCFFVVFGGWGLGFLGFLMVLVVL